MTAARTISRAAVRLSAAALVAAGGVIPARAGVVGVTVADASSGNYTLTSLTVDRGSGGTHTYLPGQLARVDLTDVASVQLPLAVQSGNGLPAVGTRATLLEDGRLDTGVINPFSTGAAAADSFEVTFLSPVVNSAGDDVVFLEIGSGDPTRFWILNDRANRGVEVTASNFSAAVVTGMPFTLYKYDNSGDQNVSDLAELESSTGFTFDKNDNGNVVALGLDLSAFGVASGATVTSIRFQSVGLSRIDPVYIVGLPPLPVAGDANLDGVVNADDYVLIDRGYSRYLSGAIPPNNAVWKDGDFDRNGVIDGRDYLLIDGTWASANSPSAEFFTSRASQFGDAYVESLLASVPEPASTFSTLLLAGSALAFRRRRSQ